MSWKDIVEKESRGIFWRSTVTEKKRRNNGNIEGKLEKQGKRNFEENYWKRIGRFFDRDYKKKNRRH